jgi:hypothetical protein
MQSISHRHSVIDINRPAGNILNFRKVLLASSFIPSRVNYSSSFFHFVLGLCLAGINLLAMSRLSARDNSYSRRGAGSRVDTVMHAQKAGNSQEKAREQATSVPATGIDVRLS